MIVVTVARKPLAEGSVAANVLEHDVGALNIDGTRISTGNEVNPSIATREAARRRGRAPITGRSAAESSADGRIERRGSHEAYLAEHPGERLGRWPANLVLQHLDGCRQVGTKLVKASSGIRPKDVGVTYGLHKSGSMAGAKIPVLASSHSDADGNETVDAWECKPGCPVADLDVGEPETGASRYFKQFGGNL